MQLPFSKLLPGRKRTITPRTSSLSLQADVLRLDREMTSLERKLIEQKSHAHLMRKMDLWSLEIDQEVQRLEGQLKSLQNERQSIIVTLGEMRNAKYLPSEIWSTIFLHTLPDKSPYVRPNSSNAPLILLLVCREWRDICLATPTLWASLSLNKLDEGAAFLAMARTWLASSGTCPLSLEIFWSIDHRTYHGPDLFIKTILPHSARWRNLRLCVANSYLPTLLNNPNVPMPLLKSLELIILVPLEQDKRVTISESATNLCRFSMLGLYQDPRHVDFPWAHLTEFDSRYPLHSRQTLDLLRQCPRLECCSLALACHKWETAGQVEMLLLPSLHSLKLTTEHGGSFMDILELPRLANLHLVSSKGYEGWAKEESLSLASRCSHSLKSLTIQEWRISQDELYEYVQQLPPLLVFNASYAGSSLISSAVSSLISHRNAESRLLSSAVESSDR